MGSKSLPRAWLRGSVLGGFALLASPAFADQPATLTDALVDAYYNNPTLQEQRAALRQADEEVPAALSGWRPTVTFQGQIGRVTGVEKYATTGINPVTNLPVTQHTRVPENGTEKIGQLTLTQPIYNGGKTTSQTRQAKNDVYAARAQLLSQ
ncbi:MAG: TolC family protein, partial [Proteobacteria bacterium]|nr:TolC family protein [Pseudomonadota bacterium]